MPALEDGCPCRPKQRHERSERHHAFTRQPTRRPLRKRPPCTLRIAKVERGGKKSDRDEKQRKNMRQFGKSQRRIEQAEAQHGREPVTEAGKRRKDDDRGGGMHGRLASPPRGAPQRPKFPHSVSGYALDTSPPEGVEERRELAKAGSLPPPLQGGRCRARRARRRGGTRAPGGGNKGHRRQRHILSRTPSSQAKKPLAPSLASASGSACALSANALRGRGGRYLFTGFVPCSGIRSMPPRAATIMDTAEFGSAR